MEIKDTWNDTHSGETDLYFTVEIEKDKFVDVKYPSFDGSKGFHSAFSYVMDCEQGGQIYQFGTDGKGIGILSKDQEEAVLDLVSNEAEDFLEKSKEALS